MVYNNREMWDAYRLSAGGGFSLRKIVTMFFAVFLSALLVAIANSAVTRADGATWEGNDIKYGGKTYTLLQDAPTLPGFGPTNTVIYQSIDDQGNASVIALKEGFNKSQEITDAQIGSFKKDAGNNYSSAGPPVTTLAIAASSDPAANAEGTATAKNATNCAVEGIGWIICGPSRFIAQGMDKVYSWINGFLTVKPLTTDTDSGLYKAWQIALGIANACFILAFLVIIYSQITSYGISNYEIKKMIPKLIIAAVLVNISYFICAIAVDVSNILGDSVQKALIDIRDTVTSYKASGGLDWSFENVTEYVLSGGTIGVAGIAGIATLASATGGSIVSLVFLLLPALVAGILSVVVALAILAARQAIITVLIVISPLAFVAFLLPNTEKWFEKWRGLLTTMLLVFPMFSLLFGGSQLASALIIQNTDQLSVVILALFIQVAPLIITPFLIQFSGSLLGRFAGIVNNPNKGLVDRTRNWSKDYSDRWSARGKVLGGANGRFGPRRYAFNREMNKKKDADTLKNYNDTLDAAWSEDKRSHRLGVQGKYAELRKAAAHAETDEAFEKDLARSDNYVGHNIRGRQYAAEGAVKNYKTASDIAWDEAGAQDMLGNNRYAAFHTQATAQATQAQINGYRQGTAQAMQKIDYAKAITGGDGTAQALRTADALAREAAGIDTQTGPDSARASAVAVLKKSKADSIAEGRALSQHFNLTSQDRQNLAKGISVTGYDRNNVARTFTAADSEYVMLSAIEDQVSQGTVEEAIELIMQTGKNHTTGVERDLYAHREVVVDAMIKGGLPQKAAFLGGKALDDIRAGRMTNTSDLLKSAASQVAKGKLSAEVLLNQDKTSMEILVDAVEQVANGQILLDGDQGIALPVELDRLFASADRAMNDPRINSRLGERKNAMQRLANMMRNGTAYTPPRPGGAGGAAAPPPGPAGGGPTSGGAPAGGAPGPAGTPGGPGAAAGGAGAAPYMDPDDDDDIDDIDDALYDL